ncbi:hypothetical protein V2J09_000585 [Rumex salicifolius]
MGAHHSIHAGKAKIDVKVDLTHKLCSAFLLSPFRDSGSPLSLVIGSLCINHPNLFGGCEKLDVFWDKGLCDTNVSATYKRPRPEWLSQQCLSIQHSIFPEIAVHGLPVDNFSRCASGGVNLCRLSMGLDLSEPASYHWSSRTSVKFEHVRPVNDEGRPISRDLDGFSLTSSGNAYDSMVVLKQETRYANANHNCFTRVTFPNYPCCLVLIQCFFQLNVQIEQGIPVLSKWLIFNRFKFIGTKGGSIVGDMAPYQAFTIGGQGSVRGYGEGAVGTGRSFLIANSDLTIPLSGIMEGSIFMDYGTDMGSGRLVPGNPGLRHNKPGNGIGVGYGFRVKSPVGLLQVNVAYNAYQQKTVYFDIARLTS